jgi:hypothetical protein
MSCEECNNGHSHTCEALEPAWDLSDLRYRPTCLGCCPNGCKSTGFQAEQDRTAAKLHAMDNAMHTTGGQTLDKSASSRDFLGKADKTGTCFNVTVAINVGEGTVWHQIGKAWEKTMRDGRRQIQVNLNSLPLGDRIYLFESED